MGEAKYLLLTAAFNEENLIENTIRSIISQKVRPDKWIIINDGSTDRTEEIVNEYQKKYSFIKLITKTKEEGRNFASKVFALNYGLKSIDLAEYTFLGILDADVTFEPDFYSSLINKFEERSKLGIAGGIYYDVYKDVKIKVYPSPYSVRGATQFFRRECFEQIGGLLPLKYGGEDGVACTSARMYGWEIQNFKDLEVLHNRLTGTANSNIFRTRFRDGLVEYSLGYHPAFQFVKSVSRMVREKPYLVGSLFRLLGFWYANVKREKRLIPTDILKYTRKDQIARIFKMSF